MRNGGRSRPVLLWCVGAAVVAVGILGTGGSAGWPSGGRPLAAVLVAIGFFIGGMGTGARLTHSRRKALGIALAWGTFGLVGLGAAGLLPRLFESMEAGPVRSLGFVGILLAAAIVGAGGGASTCSVLRKSPGMKWSAPRVAMIIAVWAGAIFMACLATIVLGVPTGELAKPLFAPVIGSNAAFVVGWAVAAVLAGTVPGFATVIVGRALDGMQEGR